MPEGLSIRRGTGRPGASTHAGEALLLSDRGQPQRHLTVGPWDTTVDGQTQRGLGFALAFRDRHRLVAPPEASTGKVPPAASKKTHWPPLPRVPGSPARRLSRGWPFCPLWQRLCRHHTPCPAASTWAPLPSIRPLPTPPCDVMSPQDQSKGTGRARAGAGAQAGRVLGAQASPVGAGDGLACLPWPGLPGGRGLPPRQRSWVQSTPAETPFLIWPRAAEARGRGQKGGDSTEAGGRERSEPGCPAG